MEIVLSIAVGVVFTFVTLFLIEIFMPLRFVSIEPSPSNGKEWIITTEIPQGPIGRLIDHAGPPLTIQFVGSDKVWRTFPGHRLAHPLMNRKLYKHWNREAFKVLLRDRV